MMLLFPCRDQADRSPLHLAALKGSMLCCKSVLDKSDDCANWVDKNKVVTSHFLTYLFPLPRFPSSYSFVLLMSPILTHAFVGCLARSFVGLLCWSSWLPQVRKWSAGKKILQGKGKVREFHSESGKI